MTYDEFSEIAGAMWQNMPEGVLEVIRGGLEVSEDVVKDDRGYLLGKVDPDFDNFMITINFGSFVQAFPDADDAKLKLALEHTLAIGVKLCCEGNMDEDLLSKISYSNMPGFCQNTKSMPIYADSLQV